MLSRNIERLVPIAGNQRLLLQFVQVIIGALFIGLLAQVRILLPYTPVPITLQTFAVLLLAASLGSKKGTWAVLTYLSGISLGLPILNGAVSNPLALFGPTAGYLFGFIPLAYCTGWIFERRHRFNQAFLCMCLTFFCLLQLFIGALWLANFVGMHNAFALGFVPFVPGEMLKVLAVAVLFNSARTRLG